MGGNKLRAAINEIKNGNKINTKNQWNRDGSLRLINKTDKHIPKPTNRQKLQLNKIRDEKEDTTDTTAIQKIIRIVLKIYTSPKWRN